MQAPYACSLPSLVDFGNATIGSRRHAQPVTFTNSGNAPLSIQTSERSTRRSSATWRAAAGHGRVPGASCTATVTVNPAARGPRRHGW